MLRELAQPSLQPSVCVCGGGVSLPGAGQALGRGPGSWPPGLPSHWSLAVIITSFHMAPLINGKQKSGGTEIGVRGAGGEGSPVGQDSACLPRAAPCADGVGQG